MRLIDADELKSKIQKSNCNIEHLWKRVVLDVIDNCKTAYDVDELWNSWKYTVIRMKRNNLEQFQ